MGKKFKHIKTDMPEAQLIIGAAISWFTSLRKHSKKEVDQIRNPLMGTNGDAEVFLAACVFSYLHALGKGKKILLTPTMLEALHIAKKKRSQGMTRRMRIFYRDHGTCVYCEKPLTIGNFTLDHVMPLAKGGTDRLDNLVLACKTCNQKKRDKTLEQSGMTIHKTSWPSDGIRREGYTFRRKMRQNYYFKKENPPFVM